MSDLLQTENKTCAKCGCIKSKSEFYKDLSRKDGVYPYCKKCSNSLRKKRYKHVFGYIKPRLALRKDSLRQNLIIKYGIDVVEAMESISDYE